jgi:hypothetical protein
MVLAMGKKPYEKPAVIYQDVLKTRAGSPFRSEPKPSDPSADPFDPSQIFGND